MGVYWRERLHIKLLFLVRAFISRTFTRGSVFSDAHWKAVGIELIHPV